MEDEMGTDYEKDFMTKFETQIKVLETLKMKVDRAIWIARNKVKQVNEEGKSLEEVFGPLPPKK
jgi:hypothetical protein